MAERNIRRIALRLLRRFEVEEQYINLVLEDEVVATLAAEERRFLTALLYGTVERLVTLDHVISTLAARPAKGMAPHTKNALRLGLYQLLYMDGVPDFAAVNETVALAGSRGERGFINAVMRAAIRTPEKFAPPAREKDPVRYLSLTYAFSEALVRHFLAEYGEKDTEAILAAFNETKPLTLRVNTEKTDRVTLLSLLREAGYEGEETPFAPHGIRMRESVSPADLPGFFDGLFYVQDEASQIAVAALDASDATLAVDTCACPGGKSFGLAMDMKDGGTVHAFDLHESKLPLIREGADRLGLSSIRAAVHDGSSPKATLCGKAERVLCDAPCSGLGVLGKKADLRHRAVLRTNELPPLQKNILAAASTYVKAGGTLVYSTCTLNRRENEQVCLTFLRENSQFRAVPFAVGELSAPDGMLTLLPHLHRTDGFFIAKFERIG
ncbi:MAG: 16S rRNA (cytosine(967)-C(5))-methyltransferase RsmB [Clostridia bacterium]|nr:16S rRNA (cytosine(967)-C(5))-methyltransferase RsmB [Clostridia bacterium]